MPCRTPKKRTRLRSTKLNPNNPRVYSTRGELLFDLKEPDRALADFNYLISWYETEPSAARPVPKPIGQNDAKSKSEQGRVPKNDSNGFTLGIAQETTNDFDLLLQSDRALWQKRIDERTAAVKKVLPVK